MRVIRLLAICLFLGTSTLSQAQDSTESGDPAGEPERKLQSLKESITSNPNVQLSHPNFATSPNGKREYLGVFTSEYVTLILRELPPHELLEISFDLIVIGSWDGSNTRYGPDLWKMGVVGGPRLIYTTFNNCDLIGTHEQAYPDDFPLGPHESRTGASETHSLGFPETTLGQRLGSSIYPVRVVVPHTASQVALYWAGEFNDRLVPKGNPGNNAWAISNISVRTLPKAELTSDDLGAMWDALRHKDPVQSNEAIWKLVAAGNDATEYLAAKLGLPTSLDDTNDEIEYASTQTVLDRRRIARARRVLSVIDSLKARNVVWQMDRPGNPYEQPPIKIEQYTMQD